MPRPDSSGAATCVIFAGRDECRCRRASPGTPGKALGGLRAIVYRQRSIRCWRVDGSSNAPPYPRSFRPTGCIGPRNGICAKSLSCLLVAEPLAPNLFLAAKHLFIAAMALIFGPQSSLYTVGRKFNPLIRHQSFQHVGVTPVR